MKTGHIYHWESTHDMPAEIQRKAEKAGMWSDDIDHIWFVKTGRKKNEDIIKAENGPHGIVMFKTDDGIFYVDYHS